MLLAIVPLVAVTVILAAAWRWGGVRTARLANDTEVYAVLAQEHPEWRATEVARALDARVALAFAPPDPAVAVVFAHGDVLTSRLLHAGDLAAVQAGAVAASASPADVTGDGAATDGAADAAAAVGGDGVVRAQLRLHDVGCPRLALVLGGRQWATWAPRLQRLVGAGAVLLGVAAATPALAHADGWSAGRHAWAPCDALYRASWSPAQPRPGTLFTLQLTTTGLTTGLAAPAGRVGNERLHFRASDHPAASPGRRASSPQGTPVPDERVEGAWGALAAVPIDAERSIALRLACPDASGDSATIRIPLASASYPMERLRVAPRFSAPPDSALSARMARESERAGRVSRLSHDTPRLWELPFIRPRESRVTSPFGHGRVFNGSVTSRHMGTDYAGLTGAPVRAANRGVVRLVDEFYLGGNVVYLDHGEGVVTAYLHLSKQLVAEGDTVARGQRIGLVGATGRVTGPHLHWIARLGRVSVDPASLLRVTAASEERAHSPIDPPDAKRP